MSEPPLCHGARVPADDVRVVEAGETIVKAGERDRLNVWHRHVGQERDRSRARKSRGPRSWRMKQHVDLRAQEAAQ